MESGSSLFQNMQLAGLMDKRCKIREKILRQKVIMLVEKVLGQKVIMPTEKGIGNKM